MTWLLFAQVAALRLHRGLGKEEISNLFGMALAGLALAYLSVRAGLGAYPVGQFSLWGFFIALGATNKRVLQTDEPHLLLTQPLPIIQVVVGLSVFILVDAILLWLPFVFGFSVYVILASAATASRVLGDMMLSLSALVFSVYVSTLVLLSIRPSVRHLKMPWAYCCSRFLDRVGRHCPYLGQELGFVFRRPLWIAIWLVGSTAVWISVFIRADSYTLSLSTSLAPLVLGMWGLSIVVRYEETALMRVIGASILKEIWTKELLLLSASGVLVVGGWVAKALHTDLSPLDVWGVLITSIATSSVCSAVGLWVGTIFWNSMNRISGRQAAPVLVMVAYAFVELPAIVAVAPLIRGESLLVPPAVLATLTLAFALGVVAILLVDAARRMERVSIYGERP